MRRTRGLANRKRAESGALERLVRDIDDVESVINELVVKRR